MYHVNRLKSNFHHLQGGKALFYNFACFSTIFSMENKRAANWSELEKKELIKQINTADTHTKKVSAQIIPACYQKDP